jgi:lipoate-protein ligase A
MPLNNQQFLNRLAVLTDPSLLCDILDISTEDIIERFEDYIEDYMKVLREAYDVDIEIDYEEEEIDG